MKTEFRNRAFLPVALPLMILLGMLATIGLFAWILLYNTKDGAIALASVMAIGILASIGLASSQDSLDPRRKAGVLLAIAVPVLLGAGLAGTGGGVDDEALLNINREPHEIVPEINVTLVATNSQTFEQSELTLPSGEETAIIFDNQEVDVPHNVAVKAAGDGGSEPADLNDPIGATAIVPGPAETFLTLNLEPGAYFFWCQVHPNMKGFLNADPGATPSAA